MTETIHTRSRRAALGGLAVQLVAFGAMLALGLTGHSAAIYHLAWYVLGGVPLWFAALLVFRQRELAALEALDLEELRRERQAAGGEQLFESGVGPLGFRVAEARLQWMLRWLVPAFSLAGAVYLATLAFVLWRQLTATQLIGGVEISGYRIGAEGWPVLTRVPVAMVVLAVLMLGLFLFSRYASGMARVAAWQLLRGCGSYMLGNTLLTVAALVALGVYEYTRPAADKPGWAVIEQTLAYAVPIVMWVLAAEILANLVLDLYRPRAPGVEPRAAFDSRLLGLLAEPGGIASSIADAINYQFGFQVSHTWFYQLLQRTAVPLVLTGALALWLLTTVVIVQPYEHVIIERWGRQLNAAAPLRPGCHFKLPYPIEVARAYNTGQLHQFNVGFKKFDAEADYAEALKSVSLWTDEKHLGQEHFDFLICPMSDPGADEPPATAPADDLAARRAPVHLIRMDVAVHYRIEPDKLDVYTRVSEDPHRALIDIAWEEVGRFTASSTAEQLLSSELRGMGDVLRNRIAARAAELGLEIVYVGVTNVHPERTVAEAFRNVVRAEQEKVSAIREALVSENERLSKVAGDADRARSLATAIRNRKAADVERETEQLLAGVLRSTVEQFDAQLATLAPQMTAHVAALAQLERARDAQHRIELEFELGLGQTLEQRRTAAEAVEQAEAAERQSGAALAAALAPLRTEALRWLTAEQADVLIRRAEARAARAYWDGVLARGFTPARLEGEAAARLARALSTRWETEMSAIRDLTRLENEREAFRLAPQIYKARRLMEVLVNGLKDARKYFLAFDPHNRKVRVRLITEDDPQIRPEELAAPKMN